MTGDLPLTGLKIVVTRPRDQAVQLARSIEQAGGVPLLFPLLEIAAAQDSKALHEQISRLDQFDLAIFISPNAVRYGVGAICKIGTDNVGGQFIARSTQTNRAINFPPTTSSAINTGDLSSTLKIATIGQSSAKALRELGISNIIAPAKHFDSEGLLALPDLQNVAGWRVLIFRGDGGRELLGDTLKARGAEVEYAECYRRLKPQQDARAWLDAKPDAITVTSSEALMYLWDMLDEQGRTMLATVPLFVPHKRIAELAQKQGWLKVQLTASGDDGMLSGLIAWAEDRKPL